MAKKHEMTDHEYDVYRKGHAYPYPLEEEEGKVRREKARYAELRRRSERRLEQRLRRIQSSADVEDLDEDPELDVSQEQARRELGNARAHKQRLRRLEEREDS